MTLDSDCDKFNIGYFYFEKNNPNLPIVEQSLNLKNGSMTMSEQGKIQITENSNPPFHRQGLRS
jgi:hypothetical protein